MALLTEEQERRLVERIKSGDDSARWQLVAFYQPYIRNRARKYIKQHRLGDDFFEDLVSEFNLKVYHCADSFEPDRGRFFKYIGWHLLNQADYVCTNETVGLRVPTVATKKLKRLRAALQAGVRAEELTVEAKLSAREIVTLQGFVGKTPSLNQPVGYNEEGSEITLLDVVADVGQTNPETTLLSHDLASKQQAIIVEVLASVRQRSRRMFIERFLNGEERPNTLDVVAKAHGVSKERVRQITAEVLQKIRAKLVENNCV